MLIYLCSCAIKISAMSTFHGPIAIGLNKVSSTQRIWSVENASSSSFLLLLLLLFVLFFFFYTQDKIKDSIRYMLKAPMMIVYSMMFRSSVREFVWCRWIRLFLFPRTLAGTCDLRPRRLLASCQSMQGMLTTTCDTNCQGLVGAKPHKYGLWGPWVL